MHTIPTVRVVNPTAPHEWIVMNAADVQPHHELWAGEVLPVVAPPKTVVVTGADETTIALRVVSKLLSQRFGISVVEWNALPVAERLGFMQDAEAEIDRALGGRSVEGVWVSDEPLAGAGEGVQVPTVDLATGEALPEALRIAKGARGKFFVKRGSDNVAGGFDTEAEAERALAAERNAGAD